MQFPCRARVWRDPENCSSTLQCSISGRPEVSGVWLVLSTAVPLPCQRIFWPFPLDSCWPYHCALECFFLSGFPCVGFQSGITIATAKPAGNTCGHALVKPVEERRWQPNRPMWKNMRRRLGSSPKTGHSSLRLSLLDSRSLQPRRTAGNKGPGSQQRSLGKGSPGTLGPRFSS